MPEKRFALSGTACCLTSALAYTAVSLCMRQLTTLRCDPFWAVFNRELVTTAVVAPWLAYRALRGQPIFPSGRTLAMLLLVGLLVEVVGNVCCQWALGVVGLAVTIPAQFGLMITTGAVLGRVGLGERVSIRSVGAIALLLVALVLLGLGAEAAAVDRHFQWRCVRPRAACRWSCDGGLGRGGLRTAEHRHSTLGHPNHHASGRRFSGSSDGHCQPGANQRRPTGHDEVARHPRRTVSLDGGRGRFQSDRFLWR